MGGGAWPFLVRGVICLLNCDNERDLNLLTSYIYSASKLLANFSNLWRYFGNVHGEGVSLIVLEYV